MQDFYILQRTPTALDSEQAKKWFYTVEMLGPGGIMAGDDDTTNLMLGMQDRQYVYILPLIRHLTFFNTRLQFNPSTLVSFDGLITLKKKRNFTLQKIIVLEKRGSHEPFMSF
mgnify:CR=1 FL=1